MNLSQNASIARNYFKGDAKKVKWFFGSIEGPLFRPRFEITLRALTAMKNLRDAKVAQIGKLADGHINHYNDYRDIYMRLGLMFQGSYNGATRPRISQGDVAVVIGDGLVGQYAGHVLRHGGAYVIIAGLQKSRLELAAKYSADEVFDCSGKDLKEYMLERYPAGVPVVVETASNTETVRLAIDLLGRDGQLVLNGFYPPPESLLDESAGFLGVVLDWRECQRNPLPLRGEDFFILCTE